jgi:hypothetical protein
MRFSPFIFLPARLVARRVSDHAGWHSRSTEEGGAARCCAGMAVARAIRSDLRAEP